MKAFLDTSAVFALLDEDDLHHHDAVQTLRTHASGVSLVCHNYIHVEAIALTRNRLGTPAVAKLVDEILPSADTTWVDEALHREALTAYQAARGSGSFVDQVSFALMRNMGIEVAFAYDSDFERQGFGVLAAGRGSTGSTRLSEGATTYEVAERGETSDLVSVAEIAERSHRPISTIQSWRRRHTDFPIPITQLAAGPVWTWPHVARWIAQRERTQPRRLGASRGKVWIAPDFDSPEVNEQIARDFGV